METLYRAATHDAIDFLNYIDKTQQNLQNGKTDKMAIIEP